MKEITCIQQYVIDNLINDKRLSVENLVEILHLYCENQYQLCGAYILGAHINKPISQ